MEGLALEVALSTSVHILQMRISSHGLPQLQGSLGNLFQ